MLIRRITRVLLLSLILNMFPSPAITAGTTIKRVDLDAFDEIIMEK